MKAPSPILEVINDANQASRYQFIIIGKSNKGRYINAGFSHNHWDQALTSYLAIANNWLTGLRGDSLQSILLTTKDQLEAAEYLQALETGLEAKAVGYYAKYTASCPNAWRINGSYHNFREVNHIEQLTSNPFSAEMLSEYDGKEWGEYLITVVTALNKDFIYACDGLASGTLTYIWEHTTAHHCISHKDQISTIILSKKDNAHHLAIIEQLLNTRQRLDNANLKQMIGKAPPPPASPSPMAPNNPVTPPPQAVNDFIHAQAGKVRLPLLAVIMIIALIFLPLGNALAYTKDLSKTSSGQASRYTLAFFVPDICLASQAKQIDNTAPYYLSQGKTVYDGLTLQNKRALRRICRAVTTSTESKTRHPILSVFNTAYSVALTHKLVGGSYHG